MPLFEARPPRGSLTNLSTGEFKEFLANPTDFKRTISADYTRVAIPGLSHKRLQYGGTNNPTIPLSLFHHELIEPDDRRDFKDDLNFLESLIYPRAGQSVPSAGPPEVLFVWPNVLSVKAVVTNLEFDYRMFAVDDGRTLVCLAQITLEESRVRRLTSDEVRENGALRGEG